MLLPLIIVRDNKTSLNLKQFIVILDNLTSEDRWELSRNLKLPTGDNVCTDDVNCLFLYRLHVSDNIS